MRIMDTDRITDLEIKVAYQDNLIAELNSLVTEQQTSLDNLIKNNKFFREQLEILTEHMNQNSMQGDVKPPHY